jgi:hypothetical protein
MHNNIPNNQKTQQDNTDRPNGYATAARAELSLLQAALDYNAAGFAVIPLDGSKHPDLKTWKCYQETKPTLSEIHKWFDTDKKATTSAIGVLTGKSSGYVEVIDVDCKYDTTGTLMHDYSELIREHLPELAPKLVIASTVNNGFHIFVKVPPESIEGNQELAKRPTEEKNKRKVLIETRGASGYVVAVPSKGYAWAQGDHNSIPSVTVGERDALLTLARSFDQMPVEPEPEEKNERKAYPSGVGEISPFDSYNEKADVPALLEKHNWTRVFQSGERVYFKRPGNTDSKTSANFHRGKRTFFVFTTSSEFNSNRAYNPVQVYTQLEHGGEYSKASRALYEDGYGSRRKVKNSKTTAEGPVTEEAQGGQKEERKTKAARLIGYLSEAENFSFFSTEDEKFYVSLLNDDGNLETLALGSRNARDRFANLFFEKEGTTIGGQDVQDAINVVSVKARQDKQDVFVRMAQKDGNIYLDLANDDFDVIEITPGGYFKKKTKDIPVRFARPKGAKPLPVPTGKPDFSRLKKYVNVKDEDFVLMAGWLVTCFRTDIPLPLLSVGGEQGTGKTGLCKILKKVIDPRYALLTSTPKDERDLVISASNQWIVAFDNMSSIPSWLSDALCRLATGAGYSTRQLHTDAEEAIFNVRRMVLVNGIGDLATRNDLLRRAVQVELDVIPDENRIEELVLEKDFHADLPEILLGLIEVVAAGLKNFKDVSQDFVSTMPDFERWAVACETALGFEPGAFRQRYAGNIENAQAIALDNSIVGTAIRELMADHGPTSWEGQLKILHEELFRTVNESQQREFPKRPQDLRGELTRLKPVMRTFGIEIDPDKEKSGRRYVVITKNGKYDEKNDSGGKNVHTGPVPF